MAIRTVVWGENIHERTNAVVAQGIKYTVSGTYPLLTSSVTWAKSL